jgi:hypothetical protein
MDIDPMESASSDALVAVAISMRLFGWHVHPDAVGRLLS